MKCYRCHSDNPENAIHCGMCGASLSPGTSTSSWILMVVGVLMMCTFTPLGLCAALMWSGGVSTLGVCIGLLSIGVVGLFLYLKGKRS